MCGLADEQEEFVKIGNCEFMSAIIKLFCAHALGIAVNECELIGELCEEVDGLKQSV